MSAKNVAVVGVGETDFRTHHADKNYVELAQDATLLALGHAGLGPDDVDAVVFSMAPTQFMGVNDCEKWAVDQVFGAGKPFMRINTGGATGGSAFHAAYSHIASGQFRTVLVVGADRVAETPDAQHILNLIWDRFYEHDFALNTVTMTALAAQRYMHRYGVTEEQYAAVVVGARGNAARNPHAHLKGEISVADVMASPRISWPFKRFDICPRSSGAAAMVLCDEQAAKRSRRGRPAWVKGNAAITHSVFMGDRMGFWSDTEFADHDGFFHAARRAYRMAGIVDPVRDIQVAEIYDPFSSFLFPQLESLGFCARGQAASIHAAGGFTLGGAVVAANPSGGTLCTNPIGVTGLVRVADAALQVMGEAGGMQVAGVRNAVATAIGGSTQFFTCTVLGDDHN
ncbi:MAG: thiolase family protein [Hyphomicrobiales bacterium]